MRSREDDLDALIAAHANNERLAVYIPGYGWANAGAAMDELRITQQHAADLRMQLRVQQRNNEKRNRQLDALHLVWCSGGCEEGVHRWTEDTVTEELVQEAELNARRLRSWLENSKAKARNREKLANRPQSKEGS